MPQANVKMTVRKAGDTASIVDIAGDVTAFAEGVLTEAYTQASAKGARSILLNFGGLEYMNSSGIGLLVTLLIRIKRQEQQLLAFGLSEHYQHIFELTKLNEQLVVWDKNEALREQGEFVVVVGPSANARSAEPDAVDLAHFVGQVIEKLGLLEPQAVDLAAAHFRIPLPKTVKLLKKGRILLKRSKDNQALTSSEE